MSLGVRLQGRIQTPLPPTATEQQRLLSAIARALPAAGVERVMQSGARLELASALLRPVWSFAPFAAVTRGLIEVRSGPPGVSLAYEMDLTRAVVFGTIWWLGMALVLWFMVRIGAGVKVVGLVGLWILNVAMPVVWARYRIRQFLTPGDEVRWALQHPEPAA
jgi:hypothetical protein